MKNIHSSKHKSALLYNKIIRNISKDVKKCINEAYYKYPQKQKDPNADVIFKFRRTTDYYVFKNLLSEWVVVFLYKLKNGSPRLAFGTTKEDFLKLLNAGPAPSFGKDDPYKKQTTLILYYDIEKRDWRSLSVAGSTGQVLVIKMKSKSARSARDYILLNGLELLNQYTLFIKEPLGKDTEYCAFSTYDMVSEQDVNDFWSNNNKAIRDERERKILLLDEVIPESEIKPEFLPAYKTARKNVAMLDKAINRTDAIYFDKDANIYLDFAYNQHYQHYQYWYLGKLEQYFKLYTIEVFKFSDKKRRFSAEPIHNDGYSNKPDALAEHEINLDDLLLMYYRDGWAVREFPY